MDPYAGYTRIYDAVDFQKIADDLNGKYILMNDIDFEGVEITMIGSESAPSTGILIGNYYTISNFSVYAGNETNVGLFANNSGRIQQLHIECMTLSHTFSKQTKNIGGIAGVNNATIQSSLFLGSVAGSNINSAMAISASEESNAVTSKCYKSTYVTVSGGSSASPSTLNSESFYTDTLGWDSDIWNPENLDFETGLYPKLY